MTSWTLSGTSSALARRPVSVGEIDLPQAAERLLDEERVAGRPPAEQAGELAIHRASGAGADERSGRGLVEAGQRDPRGLAALVADRLPEHAGDRMLGRQRLVARSADHHHGARRPLPPHPSHEVAEEQPGGLVGPLEVVEHEHERIRGRGGGEQLDHRLEEQVPLRLARVGRGRFVPPQLRHHPAQLAQLRFERRVELVLDPGPLGQEFAQRLHKRLVARHRLLVAAAVEDEGGFLVSLTGEAPASRVLPMPASPVATAMAGPPVAALRQQRAEPLECVGAADERPLHVGGERTGQGHAAGRSAVVSRGWPPRRPPPRGPSAGGPPGACQAGAE